MVEIYSYNRKGLQILWNTIRVKCSSKEEALQEIYKTYGKSQWEAKCKQFNFYNYR